MSVYSDVMQMNAIGATIDPLSAPTARGGVDDKGEDQFLPEMSETDFNTVFGGGTPGVGGLPS